MCDGGRSSGGRLDECGQPAGGDDALREREPDPQRRGEDEERKRDDEPGGIDAVAGDAGEEAQQRERAPDGGDSEPEKELSREG